ncbi:MAG: HAMP domain-containing protein [Clostridia bacterium]|jgi:two-component system sensor histidine kinase VicK|nr:HAMP domain-containing protein [Clostridia bacterium]
MFRSLTVKLVLIFIVFIIAVMAVVGVFLLDRVSSFYADDFLEQMDEGFTDRLVNSLSECFDMADPAQAQKDVMTAYSGSFSFDSYRSFYILDMSGNILESSADASGSVVKTANLLSAMNRKTEKNSVSGTEYFDYAKYINGRGGESIIYIYDDLTRMKSLIWVLFSIIFQALLIGLAIALFLCFFMTRAITSPIRKLTAGAKTIASGEYDYRIENRSHDEIGELTENFNQMARKIEHSMAQVSGEREKLETIFSRLEDGVAAFDENGRMLHINDSACDMLGIPTDKEYDFDDFTKALGMPEITSAILVTETTINIPEYTIKKKAGTELITDVSFNVFNYDIGKTGYLIVIQDITDRALLEKSRREFIANVSHELRTPLTSIKGATELIIEDDQLPEPMRKRFLSIVMNESDRMTRIVKDLLVLSRLENRRMSWKMSRFSIHSALSQICDALNSEAQDHGHTLTFDSSIPEGEIIAADKERIEQVFTNLIGNSIKYTPNGGKIKVTASMAQEGKYSYKIAVSDNGIGIPEENLPRIFERFYRVDKARNSDVGGTGLGLSISKEIVDAHHGDISITSRKGEGTTVTVLLPSHTAVCEED